MDRCLLAGQRSATMQHSDNDDDDDDGNDNENDEDLRQMCSPRQHSGPMIRDTSLLA